MEPVEPGPLKKENRENGLKSYPEDNGLRAVDQSGHVLPHPTLGILIKDGS